MAAVKSFDIIEDISYEISKKIPAFNYSISFNYKIPFPQRGNSGFEIFEMRRQKNMKNYLILNKKWIIFVILKSTFDCAQAEL